MRKDPFRLWWVLLVLLMGLAMIITPITLQEGNPLPIAWAVVRLELTGAKVVPVQSDRSKFVGRAGTTEEPLTDLLAQRGWVLKDRLGGGIFYEQSGVTLSGQVRALTSRYRVYEFDKAP